MDIVLIWKWLFVTTVISQGSVATHLRCGGQCDSQFVANFSMNPTMEKFRKSVNICQSYGQKYRGPFFDSQCSTPRCHHSQSIHVNIIQVRMNDKLIICANQMYMEHSILLESWNSLRELLLFNRMIIGQSGVKLNNIRHIVHNRFFLVSVILSSILMPLQLLLQDKKYKKNTWWPRKFGYVGL